MLDALASVGELRARFGITRIGETTRLQRIGIPTMCAIVPNSDDDLSIYNGRGLTRDQALISAVMEAVERQTAVRCELAHRVAAAESVAGLNLQLCGLNAAFRRTPMPFVPARDLLTGECIEVPKALVQMPWRGVPAFASTHTNGLAAAFTLEDAVHNALFELTERHLYAVTHARAHLRPKRLLERILGTGELPFVDDPAEEIVQPTGVDEVDVLCARFARAGLRVRLMALRAAGMPLGVLAGAHDPERGDFRAGLGCSWAPANAAVRALTEAAQARAADIQAARENILRAQDPPSAYTANTRRRASLPRGRWYFDGPVQHVRLRDLPGTSQGVSADLHALVEAIGTIATRIAVVDLSPPDGAFFVVRAVVPELETTLLDGRIGPIARAIIERAV